MANDTELGIETIIEGDIKEHGVIALDARMFSEIVRRFSENSALKGQGQAVNNLKQVKKAVMGKFPLCG